MIMDKNIQAYKNIADGIVKLLHPHAEVVIHDVETQKVIHLANNISKRKIGSPSLLESFEVEFEKPIIGPYEKMNWDGRKIKSISIAIKGKNNKPVAIMCINLDISVLSDIWSVIGAFINPEDKLLKAEEVFKDDWQEKINLFVHSWLQENNKTLSSLTRLEKQKLIEVINNEGGFKGKNAAIYVAGVLGLGRATVYKYLKELK
jgi:D-arginine utilization repressor